MRGEASRYKITLSFVSLVRTVLSFVELILMVRIILDFLNASNNALFVQWMNRITDPLLWPFFGTFPSYELESGFVIQSHAILALVVYAFVGYLLVQGITISGSHRSLFKKNKLKEF